MTSCYIKVESIINEWEWELFINGEFVAQFGDAMFGPTTKLGHYGFLRPSDPNKTTAEVMLEQIKELAEEHDDVDYEYEAF